jgi:hypothetical protein
MRPYRRLLLPLLIVLPTLACQAAVRLVNGQSVATQAAETPAAEGTRTPTRRGTCQDEVRSVLLAANSESMVPVHFPNVDTSSSIDVPLVRYDISGNKLSAPILSRAPDNLVPYQRDFDRQRAAWELFSTMIPERQRSMLKEFAVVTDGPGGVLSAVEQTRDDPRSWILEADIADMSDTKNLAFTLLHEFGHLLTLGPSQVPPDMQVFHSPNSDRARERAAAACGSYFPGEGCSLRSSYINSFFGSFWKNIYEQWNNVDQVRDQDQRDDALHSFYRQHQDQFVDAYAVTSPVEDIAESWAFFVLSPQPAGPTIRDQKLRFFYGYPELVTLRQQILSGLCAANP